MPEGTSSPSPVGAEDLAALRRLDTPSICNALEVVDARFHFQGFTSQQLVCAFPDLPPMVGFARTATMRSTAPARADKATARQQRFAYFDYVGSGPGPRVSVVQDLDGERAGFGAMWGEVQSNIHRALGCLGVVTDGCVRDLHMVAEGFQFLAGSVKPSHAYAHVVTFGGEVNVAGMVVRSGDLIHADRHGAVVIPVDAVKDVLAAADTVAKREAVILAACKRPDFTVELLKQAIGDADKFH